MSFLSKLISSGLLLIIIVPAWGQSSEFVSIDHYEATYISKDLMKVKVHLQIMEGVHIQSSKEGDGYIIPTKIELDTHKCYAMQKVVYPKPSVYEALSQDGDYEVYKNRIVIELFIRSSCASNEVAGNMSASLRFQACSYGKCYFPRTIKFEIDTKNISQTQNH